MLNKHINSLFSSKLECITGNYSRNCNNLLGLNIMYFSSRKFDSSSSKVKNKIAKKSSQKPSKRPTKGRVPSSGYIGKTRLDLINQLFKDKLPFLKEKDICLKTLISKTIEVHDELIANHGIVDGTSRWKVITLYATGVLEGRDPANPGWLAVGKTNKWPKKIGHLRPLCIFIKDNIHNKEHERQVAEAKRLCQTLFKINKVCSANKQLLPLLENLKVKRPISPEILAGFTKFLRKRLNEVRKGITPSDLGIELFLGPSNGPNQRPKLESALEEAAVLRNDTKLFRAFQDYCIITNNMEFLEFFERCSNNLTRAPSLLSKIRLRKLTAIADKGNKPRVIALSDLWTQSLLSSLENKVLEVTRTMFPKNIAYDSHREGWKQIMQLPQEVKDQLVSLDAEAWTDNFPAVLQLEVVNELFGQKLGLCWNTLAVSCPWYIPHHPSPIYFGKGQGMGTKGSFAIAQLTDLLFIEYVLSEEYPNNSHYFMKVGDDLIVQDPNHSLRIWYERIGVPINLSKSKFKTSHGSYLEFVSRNAWNSIDYSLVSPTLVSKFLANDFYSVTLFYHLKERDPLAPSFPQLLGHKEEVLSSGKNFKPEIVRAKRKILMQCISILQTTPILDLDEVSLDEDTWEGFTPVDLINLTENLIRFTLAKLTKTSIEFMDDHKHVAQSNLSNIIHGEMQIVMSPEEGMSTIYNRYPSSLYKASNSLNLSFRETVILQRAMPFIRKQNTDMVRGIENISQLPNYLPFHDVTDTTATLNPEFIKFIIETLDKLIEVETGHKVVGSDPFASRKGKPMLTYLFRDLYKIITNKPIGLNDNDERMTQLYEGYCKLYKFDVGLAQIAEMRRSNCFDNANLLLVNRTLKCFVGPQSPQSYPEHQ